MSGREEPLSGGNATQGVVLVDGTVRKPSQHSSGAVVSYMDTVRSAGVDVPRTYGRDDQDRVVIEFVPGTPALEAPPLPPAGLARVGAIVRSIHDASPGAGDEDGRSWDVLLPIGDADTISHHDLAPWNLIVGERWVFIDWDGAGPSTRSWDLAYAALTFTLSDFHQDPEIAAARLGSFVAGYGADHAMRVDLPSVMTDRARAMHELLRRADRSGREPWGSMYREGHGEHWRQVTDYVDRHQDVWRRTLGRTSMP